jgi:hypothetical protein
VARRGDERLKGDEKRQHEEILRLGEVKERNTVAAP